MTTGEVNLTPDAGDPVRLPQLRMSADALPMLGVQPIIGRTFTAEEDRPGGPDVVLISESLWARSFGRSTSVVGQTLRLDDRPNVVVGVMPDGADFGVLQILSAAAYSRGFADRGMKADVDIWAPLQGDVEQLPRSTHPIFVLGRLAKGATRAGAESEMTAVAADLERAYPENAASVPSVRRSTFCLRPSRSCCSWRASTWRTCCSRVQRPARRKQRSAARLAQPRHASSARFSPKRCC